MTVDPRIATRLDSRALVRVREEWLDGFYGAHPARERWCPAMVPVPHVEGNRALLDLFRDGDDEQCGFVIEEQGQVMAYLLCRIDDAESQLTIQRHNPRVSPQCSTLGADIALIEAAVRYAEERGLRRVSVSFHGFPDEIEPLVGSYRGQGFRGPLRLEMLSRELHIDPGPRPLQFRSAAEIGLDAAGEVEAKMRGWTVEKVRSNYDISLRMWQLAETDWLAAYEGGKPVGTVRTAVTHDGIGVADAFGLIEQYRGRGLGIHLLAGGLSCLSGKTNVVWLDVDEDNVPARRVYERACFRVHHLHGEMAKELQ